jgi:hypothetical protein
MERAAFKTRDLYSTRFSIRKARFAFVVMVRKTLLVADEIRLRIDARRACHDRRFAWKRELFGCRLDKLHLRVADDLYPPEP